MPDRLYRVLKPGVRQRVGDGWRRPTVGDFINVSDEGAPLLLAGGFIELAHPEADQSEPTPAPEQEA